MILDTSSESSMDSLYIEWKEINAILFLAHGPKIISMKENEIIKALSDNDPTEIFFKITADNEIVFQKDGNKITRSIYIDPKRDLISLHIGKEKIYDISLRCRRTIEYVNKWKQNCEKLLASNENYDKFLLDILTNPGSYPYKVVLFAAGDKAGEPQKFLATKEQLEAFLKTPIGMITSFTMIRPSGKKVSARIYKDTWYSATQEEINSAKIWRRLTLGLERLSH